mmetsp:Transcript_19315/g.41751  ORF Transcript_19315/g.41751 Transcript_19315/m.41751 type:complete len:97 (-) Transcript_19315:158-448(-)
MSLARQCARSFGRSLGKTRTTGVNRNGSFAQSRLVVQKPPSTFAFATGNAKNLSKPLTVLARMDQMAKTKACPSYSLTDVAMLEMLKLSSAPIKDR